MIKLMAPCLGDDSPLVRARAVELLARTDEQRYRSILKRFAEYDTDPIVREIAACAMEWNTEAHRSGSP